MYTPSSSVSLSSCLISIVTAWSVSKAATSTSVVLDMKKWPKKSIGRTPVDVRTRIIASNTTVRSTFLFTSSISLWPSTSAWKYNKYSYLIQPVSINGMHFFLNDWNTIYTLHSFKPGIWSDSACLPSQSFVSYKSMLRNQSHEK